MKLILGFPGQGSQKAKIGQALAAAYPDSAGRVFARIDTVLGDNLFTRIVWNDHPQPDELAATANTQPIVLGTSIAVLEALRARGKFEPCSPANTACLLGHSLGEFSCLVAAGSLSLDDAVRLVRRRGQTMQAAADAWGKTPAMSAVLGLTWAGALDIQRTCPPGLVVEAAGANGPEQTVLSGCEEGVAWGVEQAKTRFKAKRGLKVNVSCPFHSSVMRPAADVFSKDLADVTLDEPKIPIVFGYDAAVHSDPNEIRKVLLQGMYSPVMWANCVAKAVSLFGQQQYQPLMFKEIGGDTLKFGVTNVPNLTVGKSVRPIPEDVEGFSLL